MCNPEVWQELQVPHPHGPAPQAYIIELGNDFLEINVAVAAVEMIEKALPGPRGPSKIDGQCAAARL